MFLEKIIYAYNLNLNVKKMWLTLDLSSSSIGNKEFSITYIS